MLRFVTAVLGIAVLAQVGPAWAQAPSEIDQVAEAALSYVAAQQAAALGKTMAVGVVVNDERRADVESRLHLGAGEAASGVRLEDCRQETKRCVPKPGDGVVWIGIADPGTGRVKTVRLDHYARIGERVFKQSFVLEVSQAHEEGWFVSREVMHEMR